MKKPLGPLSVSLWAILAAGVCWGMAGHADILTPRIVDTVYPTEDVVIASLIVDAPRDGSADASPAIQAAIDAAAAAGGAVVFLPDGRYRLERPIKIVGGVTLRGDWAPPGDAGVRGTLLMPVSGRGEPEGEPAITIDCGGGLREVNVWYPEQDPMNIAPYPWTLRTASESGADNYTAMNLVLVNPYQAFKTGPEGNELHTVRNVRGTPLKTGVWIDTCTDIGRVIDIDFGPQWWERSGLPGAPTTEEQRRAVRAFLQAEGTAVDMGRSDWEYLYNLRIEGYGVGLLIRPGKLGTTNAVLFGGEFRDCGVAVLLERLNGVGLSVTGTTFHGGGVAVHGPASFDTVAQFHACVFDGALRHAALLEGDGTLTFQHCAFRSWTESAVEARAGSVSIIGCDFGQPGRHVVLGDAVQRARVLGNRFAGDPGVSRGAGRGDIQIAHTPLDLPAPDVSLPPPAPHPRPAGGALVVVTDEGASPDLEDNTAAFARALAKAGASGGGTVYVPAGNYRFRGELTAPSGVELRGVFDVPHHTVSGGSVLMPLGRRGEEDGPPFIGLEAGSGLRGLTFWYPEQNVLDIAPYPWTVRSLGRGCWILDTSFGHAYQGADFWTHPSDGHVIRYMAGAFLRRGLFVSKSDGEGWVEDLQFNPHYGARLHPTLPRPTYPADPFGQVIDTQRGGLDGIVFGRCAREYVVRTFIYAAYDGLAFRDDSGGANARVIMHGTDTGSRCVTLSAPEADLEFVNAQLVPLGKFEIGAIIAEDSFAGTANFFNSQMWAGDCSGIVGGRGAVGIYQLNTLSGGFTFAGGDVALVNTLFQRDLSPHVAVEASCASARVIANICRTGPFRIVAPEGPNVYVRGNSASLRPESFENGRFGAGWEDGEPTGSAHTVAESGGGRRSVSDLHCAPVDTTAYAGARSLRIAGVADDPDYSYVYFRIFDEPLRIHADSTLRYRFLPANERGRHVCVDALFQDGSTLRDSGARTADGQAMHPGTAKGTVGEWSEIRVSLGGALRGKTVAALMVGYDSRGGGGPFEAFIDDLEITTAIEPALLDLAADPPGGIVEAGARVRLDVPAGYRARYTLNGMSPTAGAAPYEGPIPLERPGLHELRYTVESPAGDLSPWVFAELYEVR